MVYNQAAAISFVRNVMYKADDKLPKVSTNPGGDFTTSHFIHGDAGLYYAAMYETDPANANTVLKQAVDLKSKSGRCQNTLYTYWADLYRPEWRAALRVNYANNNSVFETWTTLPSGWRVINHNMTGSPQVLSTSKNDVKCHYIINQMCNYYRTGNNSNLNNAKTVWQLVLDTFDDSVGGYVDTGLSYREMYILGLIKICGRFTELASQVGPYVEPTGLFDGNVQSTSGPYTGGIATRYTSNGTVCNRTGSTYDEIESTDTWIIASRVSNSYFL